LVPFAEPDINIIGRRVKIRVTSLEIDNTENTPLSIRRAMVGKSFTTVLTAEQVIEAFGEHYGNKFPLGSRIAYADEVVKVLLEAGSTEEAILLQQIALDGFCMFAFPYECYVVEEDGHVEGRTVDEDSK